MRIAIVGDFHLNAADCSLTESAMDDIARARPDLVIPLGDFGSRETIGSPAGLDEAMRYLQRLSAPLRPIMGNHDLERESGAGTQLQGTMQHHFNRLFGLDRPYGVLERENVRLFFASTDPQPPDSCYSVQECYVSDEQFDWLRGKLRERPGVPVIFFTHAPPIGCGLRTVPRTHVRATNAYLDQNHDPYRWLRLYRDTPEIIMWFSAHYHLGHSHPDSQTCRCGTRFFTTGVHGDRTRDGQRQSRLLHIDAGEISVRTIDHIRRTIVWAGGWSCRGDWRLLTNAETAVLSREHAFPAGSAPAVADGLTPLGGGRYLVAAENGYSWEAASAGEALLGTLHIGPALSGLAVSGQRIWMAWEDQLGWCDRDSRRRFVRDAGDRWPVRKVGLEQPVKSMASREAGGVWVFAGNAFRSVDWAANADEPVFGREETLFADRARFIAQADGVVIVTSAQELLRYSERAGRIERLRSRVLAWDGWAGQETVIFRGEDDVPMIESADGRLRCAFPLPRELVPEGSGCLPLVCLGGHRAVCLMADTAYYVSVCERSLRKLEGTAGLAVAIARAGDANDAGDQRGRASPAVEFAVAVRAESGNGHPLLQVWRMRPDVRGRDDRFVADDCEFRSCSP